MRASRLSARSRLMVVLLPAFMALLFAGRFAAATPTPPPTLSPVTLVPLPTSSTPFPPATLPPFPTMVAPTPRTPIVLTLPPPTSGMHRAGLVVRYGTGDIETRCVSFDEQEIGGDELLERSGLKLVFGLAGEVCAISGEGCPADDCFCACPFPDCQYWAYFHLNNGQWEYSEVGAAYNSVQDRDVDGWSWGPGDFSQGVLPPVIPFEQICPANEVTPWPTATINYTPTPPHAFTPVPTPTATPPPPPPPAEIPEPATLFLLASGVAALGGWAAKMRRRQL